MSTRSSNVISAIDGSFPASGRTDNLTVDGQKFQSLGRVRPDVAAQDNLTIVRTWYEHVMAGELEEAAAMMADDFVLHEPPELPYGGEYHGPQGFLEVMQRI